MKIENITHLELFHVPIYVHKFDFFNTTSVKKLLYLLDHF